MAEYKKYEKTHHRQKKIVEEKEEKGSHLHMNTFKIISRGAAE